MEIQLKRQIEDGGPARLGESFSLRPVHSLE
jgi:hypothetical protein